MLCLQSMLPVLSLESSFSLFHDELRMCNTAAPRIDAFTAIEYLNLASCAENRKAKTGCATPEATLRVPLASDPCYNA